MIRYILTLFLLFPYIARADGNVIGWPSSYTPPTAIFTSLFETSGDRSQWTPYGTVDLAYSSSGLSMQGSYVAEVSNGSDITASISSTQEICIVFQARFTGSKSGSVYVIQVNNSGTTMADGEITTSNTYLRATDLTVFQSTADSLSVNTTYWFKFYYKAGTGSDGIVTFKYWNGSSWVGPSITNSARTQNINAIKSLGSDAGIYVYYDSYRQYATDYTGDPGAQ
jgi:hypothetical protein